MVLGVNPPLHKASIFAKATTDKTTDKTAGGIIPKNSKKCAKTYVKKLKMRANARKCARKIHGRAQKERKTAWVIGGCKIGWVEDKSG